MNATSVSHHTSLNMESRPCDNNIDEKFDFESFLGPDDELKSKPGRGSAGVISTDPSDENFSHELANKFFSRPYFVVCVEDASSSGNLAAVQDMMHAWAASKDCFQDAIDCAIRNNHFEIVRYLVENEVPLTSDHFRLAIQSKSYDSLKLFLEHDFELNDSKETPLHFAAAEGALDVVGFLVTKGADPMLSDAKGSLAIDVAQAHNHQDVVQYLSTLNPLPAKL